MASAPEKGKRNPFWDFFSSVRLTIALLILLAVASIIGTLIPQQDEAARMAHGMSPALVQLFSTFQLFDVYHSFWFRIIIAALGLNLFICSLDRFPVTWKRFKGHDGMDRSSVFKDVPPQRVFSAAGEKAEATRRVAQAIKRRYRNVRIKNSDQEDLLYAEKGRYSHFGVYLTHLSVLFILIGGMIGSFFGFQAQINIPEGGSEDTVFLRRTGQPKGLGFSVRCDSFTVEFYENRMPKEYRSELSFLENGQVVQKASLLVNHPAEFRGVTFYQASYGTTAGDKVALRIEKEGSPKKETAVEARKGVPFKLPDDGGEALITDVQPDFMRLGPAAQIQIKPDSGEPVLFWIFLNSQAIGEQVPGLFERSPRFNYRAFKPYSFFLQDVQSKYYTGLQVNRDPGVNLVWIGCIAMICGFFLAFYASHRRLWVRVREKGKRVEVSVAGRSTKNRPAMNSELDRWGASLKDILK